MAPEAVASNPRLADNTGRVAVQRGPVVYCMEQLDQPHGVALSDVSVNLKQKSTFQAEHKSDLLDGVTVLHHNGEAYEVSSSEEPLYPLASSVPAKTKPEDLTLIPYYAWANRDATAMQVWVPYKRT
jgi:DUF1680 family protein